jgi:hypothetical protein
MQSNSMNMSPNEKAGLGDHDEVEDTYNSSPSRRERSHSLSGRELEDGETLDTFGRGRRKQSMAAHAVGKMGTRIRRLPGLPSRSSPEREAQRNAEKNKVIPDSSDSDPSDKSTRSQPDERPPWERLDFITAVED